LVYYKRCGIGGGCVIHTENVSGFGAMVDVCHCEWHCGSNTNIATIADEHGGSILSIYKFSNAMDS
jgi:hypothetical protein